MMSSSSAWRARIQASVMLSNFSPSVSQGQVMGAARPKNKTYAQQETHVMTPIALGGYGNFEMDVSGLPHGGDRPDLLVDLDGTIKTHWQCLEGDSYVVINGRVERYDPRPGYMEFLTALRGLGSVHLCTATTLERAELFLEDMGIADAFDMKFYGASWGVRMHF